MARRGWQGGGTGLDDGGLASTHAKNGGVASRRGRPPVSLGRSSKPAREPARPEREAIVVKLGGSLDGAESLERWARIVARASRPAVIVPGGGAFAEAVREAQERRRFHDAAAHRMAILAMHQTALMLAAIEPRFVPAETVAGMRAAWSSGRVPVWLPLRMADRDRAIPADWTITSDGLAARLAERLAAAAVCLVKSRCVARAATPAQLAADGVVDRQFPVIVARGDLVWCVLGPGEERQLARLLKVPAGAPAHAGKARAGRRTARAAPGSARAGGR